VGSIPAILVILIPKLTLHFFKKKQTKTNLKSINLLTHVSRNEGKKNKLPQHLLYKLHTKKPTLFKFNILKKQVIRQRVSNTLIKKNKSDSITFK